MEDIEAISFDLDDTLVEYERSPGVVLRRAFEIVGCEALFPVEEYYARFDEFAATTGSMDELRSECFAVLAEENGYEARLGRDVADAFSDERDQTNVAFLPSVPRVLDELGRDYRLAVVTNGAPDAQRRKIDAVGLGRWVDATIVAGNDVPPKPDPEPFERAVRVLEATPATTLHVGDSLESDIAGAAAAGIDSVWIAGGDPDGGHTPRYQIGSIGDLPSLVRSEEPQSRTG